VISSIRCNISPIQAVSDFLKRHQEEDLRLYLVLHPSEQSLIALFKEVSGYRLRAVPLSDAHPNLAIRHTPRWAVPVHRWGHYTSRISNWNPCLVCKIYSRLLLTLQ